MKHRSKADRQAFFGALCRQELTVAEGGLDDELQAQRAMALRYYYGDPRGDEAEGRAQLQSTDVADSVNATLAMMRDMLIRDASVAIDANGEDDEQQARIEADVLNDVLLKDNPGEKEILAAVKDGLVLKNGCLKVHVDERQEFQELERPEDAPEEMLRAWAAQAGPMEEREVTDESLIVRRTVRRFEVRAVPIENVSYQASFDGRLQDIRFFAERIVYTRSELVEMGFKRRDVDALPSWADDVGGAGQRRNVSYQSGSDAVTRDQDRIECHECYVLVDYDGDGISERYRVLLAGENTCLEYETVDLVPYALGAPFLVPHRLTGESLFDRLKETQDVNTALLRQLVDNVSVINNGRYVYDPSRVTEADIMAPMAGGGIRARDVSAVVPLMVPDVSSGILQALEFTRRQRSEKVGAALDMASAQAQLMQKSATAASIEKGNQELMANLIAANFAATMLRDLYLLLHEFLRRYAVEPYVVRVAGQTGQTMPRDWPRRTRLSVRAGMSPTTRAQLQMALGQHLQLQAQAMASGLQGVLADPVTLYRTSMEWLRLHGVEVPESLAIDPQSPRAQQAAQAMAQAQQQQSVAQAQLQQAMMEMERAKIAEQARQHDGELAHKYYDTNAEVATAEAKLAGQAVIDLEKQRLANENRGSGAPVGRVAGVEGDR